ncbi:glycosyltransferase [Roseofilum sp. SBFL]|uniref:glycosyltransferase n=1 Tax=Roseofilum sp. SBFL TaxID=2821496 RepID=UPI00298EAF74|nr:glycosyltransferase [Roseofilum sp. SBFL]
MFNGVMLMISLGVSGIIWVILLCFWGNFWWANQQLEASVNAEDEPQVSYPKVGAIVPARNESEVISRSVRSLVDQDYPSPYSILVIDDQSTDDTRIQAQSFDGVTVISSESLPSGWTGKLWAMEQGVKYYQCQSSPPDYYLFTDADIEHSPEHLSQLVHKAQQEDLELVSVMVKLHCESVWEHLLIPAFVFFFQKLYPFPWVNNPRKSTAAAAGGCILITPDALTRIGGLERLRDALIDDCTLAQAVKSTGSGRIWLGLSETTYSLRSYSTLQPIWDMVARTAFTQLNYSPGLLLGTLLGMVLVYILPVVGCVWGLVTGVPILTAIGGGTWALMAIAYTPTAKLYRQFPLAGFALPLIASLYTLMTLDSALRHWQGRGGAWKGRVYQS